MKVSVLLLTLVAAVAAEPPADRSYLPPSAQYGAPSPAAPSTQYGAPATGAAFLGGSIQRPAARVSSSLGAAASSRRLSSGSLGRRFSGLGRAGGLSTEYGVPGYSYGRTGMQEDPLAEPANYEFSYTVQDGETLSDFGQEESRQGESAQGQYRVLLPDGRKQIVSYQADEGGYRPTVEYQDTGLTAYSAAGYGYGRGRAGAGAGAGNGGYHY
ncbi:pro-resilin-like [Schistocerca serialis cubense]|uniref:pro-resilin-like n=1 Tax=Schistocerca serialis cubense TaxID=2023355 RepID=UPI00214F2001|nr:pro-resilin-like [Schistocerca serialis cubense]